VLPFKFPLSAGTHRGLFLLSPHSHTLLSVLAARTPIYSTGRLGVLNTAETASVVLSAPNSTQTPEKNNCFYVSAKQIPCLKMQIMKWNVEVHECFQRWMSTSAGGWPGYAASRVSFFVYHVLCTEAECTQRNGTNACGLIYPALGKLRLCISLASRN